MKTLLAVVALITVVGIAGAMDYRDELKAAEHYEVMVCNGHWPNYKSIEVDCDGRPHNY